MDQTKRSVIRKILEDENDLEYSETIRNPNVLQLEINPIWKNEIWEKGSVTQEKCLNKG